MPDNTIGWGQGAANNTNGWGAAAQNNNLNWGYIHSRSYGHDETNLVGANEGSVYIQAAQEDGFIGGSASCSQESFDALSAIPTLGFAQASAYITAATADSFTGGGVYCSELFFAELENIS